jgi:hypothetical protein
MKPHSQTQQLAIKKQYQRRSNKPIKNRDHWINAAKLKFDRKPCGTPYNNG